jgi:hypothetical protein
LVLKLPDVRFPNTFWRGNVTVAGLSRFSSSRASVTKDRRHAPMAEKRDGFIRFYEMKSNEMKRK